MRQKVSIKEEEGQLWRVPERKERLEWKKSEREARRKQFKGLIDALKGVQLPEGTQRGEVAPKI